MYNTAKMFIEENIDLIENEYWKSFWEKAVVAFPNGMIVMKIAEILSEADIDTSHIRFICLDEYINAALKTPFPKSSSKGLAISNFIDRIPLNRRFGFNIKEIQNYIIENKEKFNLEVETIQYSSGSITYLRRH